MECTVRPENTPSWLALKAPSIAGAMHQRSLFSEGSPVIILLPIHSAVFGR